MVSLGVVGREPLQLVIGPARVAGHQQVVAVQRGEAAIEGQHFQSMAWKIQLPDDLGTEQRHNVGRHAEPESREDLFGDRRPAHHVAAFQDQGAHAGPSEVCGGRKPIVATADDDRVVPFSHFASSSWSRGPRAMLVID